jgi:hypothetical protein
VNLQYLRKGKLLDEYRRRKGIAEANSSKEKAMKTSLYKGNKENKRGASFVRS